MAFNSPEPHPFFDQFSEGASPTPFIISFVGGGGGLSVILVGALVPLEPPHGLPSEQLGIAGDDRGLPQGPAGPPIVSQVSCKLAPLLEITNQTLFCNVLPSAH